jgi:hypothetical protein
MYTFKVNFGGKHGNVGRAVCFLLILYCTLLNIFHMRYEFILLFDRRAAEIKLYYKCPCQFVLVVVEVVAS